MDKDNQEPLHNEELRELAEREVLSGKVRTLAGLFIGLSFLITFYACYNTYRMLADRSIPLVVCPRNYELDSPVVMKTINGIGLKGQDRWLRGFARRYATSLFPRTEEDVAPFFTYIVNHSKGPVRRKFQAYLKDAGDIANLVKGGNFYKFYPKSSTDIRIRSLQDNPNAWIIEIDSFLIKKMNVTSERFTPTLRFTVEAAQVTMDNPEGLYVVEFENEQITDYVSGRKENL